MLKKIFAKLCARFTKKTATLIVALALICCVTIAGTLAYLIVEKELTNIFESGQIILTSNNTTGIITNDTTSDVGVYIRVKLVVNYQDNNGNVLGISARKDTDYSVQFDSSSDWIQKGEYYYYTKPVAPGQSTTAIPITVTFVPVTVDGTVTNEYTGFALKVQYLAEGIQSNPSSAVKDATNGWNANLDTNGNITAIN